LIAAILSAKAALKISVGGKAQSVPQDRYEAK